MRDLIGSIPCSMWCRSLRATSFRHAVLEQVRDNLLLDWWQHYYEPMDGHQQREITSSVITKLSKFASSRGGAAHPGQPRSTIDLREVVARDSCLLVSTASGIVGTDLSELVGIVLLGLFQAALAEQAALPTARTQTLPGADRRVPGVPRRQLRGDAGRVTQVWRQFALATQSLAYLDQLDRTLRATVLAKHRSPVCLPHGRRRCPAPA